MHQGPPTHSLNTVMADVHEDNLLLPSDDSVSDHEELLDEMRSKSSSYRSMAPEGAEKSELLSVGTKLAFGFGGVGQYVYSLVLGFFMLPFLLEVGGLSAIVAGSLQAGTSFWGACVNPFVGYLSDKSPHPRRLSWVALSALPFCYFYFLAWLVPNVGLYARTAYYLVVYLTLATAYACFTVPYNTLSAELTPDYNERTNLMGYRWVLALAIGTMGAGVQAVLLYAFPEGDGQYDLVKGYALAGTTMALFLLLPYIVMLVVIREKPSTTPARKNLLEGLRITFTNKQFLLVVAMNSLSWFSLTILTNNLLLYVTYVTQAPQLFVLVLVATLSVCTIVLPVWAKVSKRIGKKKTYYLGTTILMIGLVPTAIIPPNMPALAIFLPAVAGAGLGVLYLIPYSMIPDVVEVDELKTGERREGSFFSIYIFFERVATSVGSFTSGLVLTIAGYNSADTSQQPDSVQYALRFMIGVLPAVAILLSWIACWLYDISKERHEEIREEIAKCKEKMRYGTIDGAYADDQPHIDRSRNFSFITDDEEIDHGIQDRDDQAAEVEDVFAAGYASSEAMG